MRVNPIRVLVADDDPDVREALIHLVTTEPTLHLVGAAEDAQEAIELASRHRPEVALVDARMRGGGGARVAREARDRAPETRVIALSAYEDREGVRHTLGAGVAGCLARGAGRQEIVTAIRRCAQGHAALSREIAVAIIEEMAGRRSEREARNGPIQESAAPANDVVGGGEGLLMAFQPIVDLNDCHVEGVEALARFTLHPDWGPREWFDEAGTVGRRVELERLALGMAVEDFARFPEEWFLSVNMSPETAISNDAMVTLENAAVDRLVVEITEHAQVADYAELLGALAPFRSCGGRLAIDDAGAGFASLRHVLVLLPDVIKLDMSLTHAIDQDRHRRALATALVSFASEIGAAIFAEGIETLDELETLRALGVPYGQGFYLAPPRLLSADEDPAEAFKEIPVTTAP